jgi:surfeit locus 1 family protein
VLCATQQRPQYIEIQIGILPTMFIHITNWKLALLALLFFCLFTSLGIWQLKRAEQKSLLIKTYAERTLQTPLAAQDLHESKDLRFHRIQLQGKFDTEHTFLLDNKTFHGQIGYQVYTPFQAKGLKTQILVDRGFIPLGTRRDVLPTIHTPSETITITGLINKPPTYVALGEMRESRDTRWPMRVEYINIDQLTALMSQPFSSDIITLTPNHPAAYAIEWQPVITGPERHRGYAVQWFALSLTLLILFVALNRRKK